MKFPDEEPLASNAIEVTEEIWKKRTFSNTFSGSIPRSFLKAMQIAFLRYGSPGPQASAVSIFDPLPLKNQIQDILEEYLISQLRSFFFYA